MAKGAKKKKNSVDEPVLPVKKGSKKGARKKHSNKGKKPTSPRKSPMRSPKSSQTTGQTMPTISLEDGKGKVKAAKSEQQAAKSSLGVDALLGQLQAAEKSRQGVGKGKKTTGGADGSEKQQKIEKQVDKGDKDGSDGLAKQLQAAEKARLAGSNKKEGKTVGGKKDQTKANTAGDKMTDQLQSAEKERKNGVKTSGVKVAVKQEAKEEDAKQDSKAVVQSEPLLANQGELTYVLAYRMVADGAVWAIRQEKDRKAVDDHINNYPLEAHSFLIYEYRGGDFDFDNRINSPCLLKLQPIHDGGANKAHTFSVSSGSGHERTGCFSLCSVM